MVEDVQQVENRKSDSIFWCGFGSHEDLLGTVPLHGTTEAEGYAVCATCTTIGEGRSELTGCASAQAGINLCKQGGRVRPIGCGDHPEC